MGKPKLQIVPKRGKAGKSKKRNLLGSISMWALRSTMAVLTAVVCLLLLFSAYSEWISPETWIIASFAGIAFGVLLVLALIWGIVLALVHRWRSLTVLAVALLLVAPTAWRYCPLHLTGDPDPLTQTEDGRDIEHIERMKVMTYNTCLMGHARLNDKKTDIPVLDEVLRSGADVVCLQEYSYSASSKGHSLEELRGRLKDAYPHMDFTPYSYNRRSGLAIASKYPITKIDRIDHQKKGYIAAMYYQLQTGSRTIGVVNMHLHSNKLSKEDRLLYDEMIGHFEADSLQRIRKGLLHSLAVAWRQRAKEAEMIAKYLEDNHPTGMPLLVCGDMNDTPVSYCNHMLRRGGLTDTWQETGIGPGITYSEHRFWFRIDHLLHSKGLHALSMDIRKDIRHSDHFPVEAIYQILPE